MDPTTIRIILIIVGLASLLGLYLWERRRGRGGAARRRPARSAPAAAPIKRREPSLEGNAFAKASVGQKPPESVPESPDPTEALELGSEPSLETDSLELEGDARKPDRETEPLLVQIFVIAQRGPFRGPDILEQARALGLEAGEMDIFHRYTPAGALQDPLYSMANLVRPGSFPFDDLQQFETPGLALFTELPGEPSDLMVFDELLGAARHLADHLGGELRGADREPLGEAAQLHLRSQVSAALEKAETRRFS